MQSAAAVPLMTSLFDVPMMTCKPLALQKATGSAGDAISADVTVSMTSSSSAPHAAIPETPNASAATTIPFVRLLPFPMANLPSHPLRKLTS